MARYRAASAMAPIPFDRHGVPGTIELVDDFVTAVAAAGAVTAVTSSSGVAFLSELRWRAASQDATSAGLSILVGESDHQGIIRFASVLPTSSTVAARLKLGGADSDDADEQFFIDANGIYVAAVLRIPTLAATSADFGLTGVRTLGSTETPNGSQLDGVSWTFSNGDTAAKWIAQVNGASTDVEEASTITYVANDWVLLEIASDTSGNTFRITTEDDTQTITLNATDSAVEPVVAVRPYFGIAPEADGTAATYDIDLFVLRYMRRQALVSGWLGA